MLDPGKPSFTPKKGKTSIVMFVGLQGIWTFKWCLSPFNLLFCLTLIIFTMLNSVEAFLIRRWVQPNFIRLTGTIEIPIILTLLRHDLLNDFFVNASQGREKLLHVPNMHITTRRRAGNLLWSVLTHLGLVRLISWSRMPQKLKFPFTEGNFSDKILMFVCFH